VFQLETYSACRQIQLLRKILSFVKVQLLINVTLILIYVKHSLFYLFISRYLLHYCSISVSDILICDITVEF